MVNHRAQNGMQNLRLWVCCLVIISFYHNGLSQKKYKYYDGPYIEQVGDSLDIKWVENGKRKQKWLPAGHDIDFNVAGLPKVNLEDFSVLEQTQYEYEGVSKIVSISDIHGQHDLFVKLMQNHNVIDTASNWIFGDGHLVVVGDVFDRGDKVTESLWLLYDLEKQAAKAGGKVHLLLGNHELLVLHGDLNYLNRKYFYTSGAFKTFYTEFFSSQTVLGKWLRSKNVTVMINKIAFVHGGFSEKMIKKENSLGVINKIFREKIVSKDEFEKSDDLLSLLYFDNGPLWYRGYANPNGFDIKQTTKILKKLKAEHIVVGHTSMPRIVSLHENKIFLIDSSIKFGKSGEVLIYEDGKFCRGLMNGSINPIQGEDRNKYGRSPFQYVYDLGDGELLIEINTDIEKLIDGKMEEEYQQATLIAYHDKEYNREWQIKIRARGNLRKEMCHLPPFKIDFSKSTLEYLGFSKNDKLKMVLPCDDTDLYQQGLYREHLVYEMYQLIDPYALRTRIVNFRFKHKKKIQYDFQGFIVEDEDNFADRIGAKYLEKEHVSVDSLNRQHFTRMALFQYMIRNTDWSIYNKHNMEFVTLPNEQDVLAIPYDFDYAGIVGQGYVNMKTDTPIDTLDNAYFILRDLTLTEMVDLKEFYLERKSGFLEVIEKATYLNDHSSTMMKNRIMSFFAVLEDESLWEEYFFIKRKNGE